MVDFATKETIGTLALDLDLYVAGTVLERADVLLDAIAAGYTPAVGDVLCYDITQIAQKSLAAPTYNLAPGDAFILDVNNLGNTTNTWAATSGAITDTTTYPVADQDTKSFTLTLTGGPWNGVAQTVLFAITTTSELHVAAAINDQCQGCHADGSSGQVVVTHDDAGTGTDIAFTDVDSDLTFAASVTGTGDVVLISATTAAEIKTVIEADSPGCTVDITSGTPVMEAETELDFISGTALTKLGLSIETISENAVTNKHRRYDADDVANIVIMGAIDRLEEDNTGTPVVMISYTKVASVHYGALGYDGGTLTAAEKLILVNAARLKNLNIVD